LVTTIKAACFYNCSSLNSITIPSLVTTIGAGCFYNCTNLTSVTFNIPSMITATPIITMLDNVPGPLTITFNNTADYAALSLNINVSSYFVEPPPENWIYQFNA
jgi:hypothetical protein